MAMPDPYCYEGTNVLINKLDIRDAKILAEAEAEYTFRSLQVLAQNPVVGRFGFTHLKRIHKAIFDGLYGWAGETRKHGFISKGGTIFTHADYIDSVAERIFKRLIAEDKLRGLIFQNFVERLTFYSSEINALHPFREGNGRALREFIRQLAAYNGYKMVWQGVSRDDLLNADIAAFQKDYGPLVAVYSKILIPIENM
jgi:cell filamentation protein